MLGQSLGRSTSSTNSRPDPVDDAALIDTSSFGLNAGAIGRMNRFAFV